ncbi:histone H2B.2-like [Stegodyphus dumicola]|uniref:histone H2B.2-like n=1 Tax=Stegodyphus dumicola TaxID=202533 RepID=UPI0015A96013|nr:histone H2B.2-like [Stegodyphus dumicola]
MDNIEMEHPNSIDNIKMENYFILEKSSQSLHQLRKKTYKKKKVKKEPNISKTTFKRFILRIKKIIAPKIKLGAMTLDQLDDFISHALEMLDSELRTLFKLDEKKTLTSNQLESAIRLCFPKCLSDSAIEFGKTAVRVYYTNSPNSH